MRAFQIGDRVLCLDDREAFGHQREGHTYTVTDVGPPGFIEVDTGGSWGDYRFRPEPTGIGDAATAAPKPVGLAGDAAARKAAPMASGVLFYFPNALAAVAALSKVGNDQHNPGKPLQWNYPASNDHADCLMRHLTQAGTVDTDGIPHSVKVVWRALAMCEVELLERHPELQPGKSVTNFSRGGGK